MEVFTLPFTFSPSQFDLFTSRWVDSRNLPNDAPLILCSKQNNSDWKCQSQVFQLQEHLAFIHFFPGTLTFPFRSIISRMQVIHPTLNKTIGTWVQIKLLRRTYFTAFFPLQISLTDWWCVWELLGWKAESDFCCSKINTRTKTFFIYWQSIQQHVGIRIFLRWTLTAHNIHREPQQFRC